MSSRRRYLTQEDLTQFADITITDSTEADDQISQAEEIIDSYVGPQDKFYESEIVGLAQSGSTSGFKLQTEHITIDQADYFRYCEVEIMGGAGAGQIRTVTASDGQGNITVDTVFSTALDNTSVYRLYQLAKFPRREDCRYESIHTSKWYKNIPDKVRRATAAQLQYMIDMGDKFFSTDASQRTSESIGDYSYSKGAGISNVLIAPKAKQFLRGITNRTGQIT